MQAQLNADSRYTAIWISVGTWPIRINRHPTIPYHNQESLKNFDNCLWRNYRTTLEFKKTYNPSHRYNWSLTVSMNQRKYSREMAISSSTEGYPATFHELPYNNLTQMCCYISYGIFNCVPRTCQNTRTKSTHNGDRNKGWSNPT
jgi:hypothetical protein